ncbi:MAG: folate-binding protein YgfZ [Archangiaceae bacterium]|nr:folate-binding protein YgfZ [Archangiaceae bacterium]
MSSSIHCQTESRALAELNAASATSARALGRVVVLKCGAYIRAEVVVPSVQIDVYRAAREEVAWVDLSGRELLRVTGPDRVSFVQGMVTNDVTGQGSVYAAMLTPKGGMVGDVRITPVGDALVLDTGKGFGEAVKAFLSKYLISEEAEISDAPDLAVLGLLGPKAKEQQLASAVAVMPDLLGRGVDLLVPRPIAAPALPQVDDATYEVLRVEAGIPRYGVDMTETTIPLEANLERAIHYQKGCYIGQEVIARATYRGQMAKKLTGLLLDEHTPERGTELRRGDKKVGFVTSVVRSPLLDQFIALGYVHRDSLGPGTELELASGGKALVVGLPFLGKP